jgi:anti-sigma B factor antagonist
MRVCHEGLRASHGVAVIGRCIGMTRPSFLKLTSFWSGVLLCMLKFTTREVTGVLVLAFEASEESTTNWQSTERDWLYKLIESHPDPRFAVDLSQINYLASSEIGFLVTLKRRIDRRKGRVVFFGIGPYIHDIFKSMNLTKVLDIADHQTAALAKLAAPAVPG